MRDDDPVRGLLRGLGGPRPPEELEARTLQVAGRVLRDACEVGVWERLWTSRPLRLLWATAVLVLLFGHAALSLRTALAHAAIPAATFARGELPPELRGIGDLPAIEPSSTLWESADEPSTGPTQALPNRKKETHQ